MKNTVMLKAGHSGYKFKIFRQSGVESSSTIRFIAVVIATATSTDGDDFFVVMHQMSLF